MQDENTRDIEDLRLARWSPPRVARAPSSVISKQAT